MKNESKAMLIKNLYKKKKIKTISYRELAFRRYHTIENIQCFWSLAAPRNIISCRSRRRRRGNVQK